MLLGIATVVAAFRSTHNIIGFQQGELRPGIRSLGGRVSKSLRCLVSYRHARSMLPCKKCGRKPPQHSQEDVDTQALIAGHDKETTRPRPPGSPSKMPQPPPGPPPPENVLPPMPPGPPPTENIIDPKKKREREEDDDRRKKKKRITIELERDLDNGIGWPSGRPREPRYRHGWFLPVARESL